MLRSFCKEFLKVFVTLETDLGFLLYFFEIQEVQKPKGYPMKQFENQKGIFEYGFQTVGNLKGIFGNTSEDR